MKVLFLTIGEAASTRYRVHQLLPLLERLGVRATVREVPRRLLPRLRLFHSARDHDAVVLQKRLTPPWQTRLLRRHSRRLLYDVDDAVLYRSAPAAPHSRMRLRRWRQAVRCADLVLAGNRFLGEQVQAHGGRAILVPTTLDPAPYDAASPSSPRDDALILVWIGSRSTLHYLEALEPALRRAADRSARPLKLRVICDVFPPFDFIEVLRSPWSSETQCRDLRDGDIALAPLDDRPWSAGKCGFKTLQYFASRLPVIASPHGVHQEMIAHGRNGLLADGPNGWAEAIRLLADDEALRRRLGDEGRRTLDDRYRPSAAADRIVHALRGT